MYKATIIGISGFGDVHYNDLKRGVEEGRWRIVGAVVINQADEADKCVWLRQQGVRLYTDWEVMLQELSGQIDICFIPTGISMHALMTIAALRAGANVFVEKPVAATVQEVKMMQQTATESGKFVAVGYQFIYQPDVAQIKKLLLSGRLGRILTIKSKALWSRDSIYYHRNNWAGRLKVNNSWVLDSQFNNANAHFLNLMNFFAGQSLAGAGKIVGCCAELYRAHQIESPDTAALRAVTDDGVALYFFGTHACFENSPVVVEVIGEQGKLTWQYYSNQPIILTLSDGTVEEYEPTATTEYRQHVMAALEKRLDGEESLICDLAIAGEQTLWNNSAYESSSIHPLDDKYYQVDDTEGRVRVEINNIGNIVNQAFEQEKMFSELNVPWAVKGDEVDLHDYRCFNGGKLSCD